MLCATQIPEYEGLSKPKHHFAQHVPVDILQHGPVRGYWAFAFEGFHQIIKKKAYGSTFVNVCKRVSQLWAMDFVMSLRECETCVSHTSDTTAK